MQPPEFWFTDPARPDWRSRLLGPLAGLYARATAKRVRRPGAPADVPVICVGNLNLGGTGKTPTVIALAGRLQSAGHAVHIVTRGYGGTEAGPLRVDAARHGADAVGDEALLLSAFAPVWVARDRAAGARAAVAAGAGALVLDDGFQNPSPVKDVSLIVVDAGRGFGNGLVVPAGPLREPVASGLARADALLAIGGAVEREFFLQRWKSRIPLPVLQGALQPLQTGMDWSGLPVLAFAGIGRPEKFFATLSDLGCRLLGTQALSDHQPLTPGLMRRLEAEASALGAQLVTTEKDAVRLPPEFRQKVLTVPVRLEIEDWSALDSLLDRAGLRASATP